MSRLILVLIFFPLALAAQFKNIVLVSETEQNFPLELSIVVNPDDPRNIVAGIMRSKTLFTTDGGLNWKESVLKSPYGTYGNPNLTSDHKGNIYYFSAVDPTESGSTGDEWLDRVICQRSTDKGATWGIATFIGLNPPKDNYRLRSVHHIKNDFQALTWTQFDKYGSQDTAHHSSIMFSKSTSRGDKWSEPIRINRLMGDCADGNSTATGATPAISIDSKIFIVWAHQGNIYLDRSYDEGRTWLKNDMVIGKQLGGWNFSVPGVGKYNGLPVAVVDNSASPFHGSLYVLWSDQRKGEDDTNIWLIRSSNRGDNWNNPVQVNQDNSGKHQFMPWMSVDPSNGIVYVVYYDRRNYEDDQTDVYLAWSIDGGNKFSEAKISETPFVPDATKFLGGHIGLSANKGIITPIWIRMDDGKTKVITTVIRQEDIIKK